VGSSIATIVVAVVMAAGGALGTFGMLRGKKVDAGEWLIDELRKDAIAARADATQARSEARAANLRMLALEHRIDVLEAQLEAASHRTVDVTTSVTTTSTPV
jgi:hypothetical protein